MSIPGSASPLFFQTAAGAAAAAGPIKSVRFNPGDNAHLDRTPSSAGNQRTFTIAFWCKLCDISNNTNYFYTAGSGSPGGLNSLEIGIDLYNRLFISEYGATGSDYFVEKTSAYHRDPSAWYHFIIAVDTTQATATNRVKFYVNGVEQDKESTSYPFTQNRDTAINGTSKQTIGSDGASDLNGYLADFFLIDGSQEDATSFGAYDDNGVWQASSFSGSFGTNGVHLFDFASESGIGDDSSGNDNDFTVNNLTASVPSIASPNRPTWNGSVGSNWTRSNSNYDADYSGSGYTAITAALSASTIYHFYLNFKDGGGSYGGWFFSSTSTAPSNTVPDELGGNSIGLRTGESSLGTYGTYATANGTSNTQNQINVSALNSQSSLEYNIEFVVNTTAGKVWAKKPSDSGYVGGGDPTDSSSTASFLIPTGAQYFGYMGHSSNTFANFKTTVGSPEDLDVLRDAPTNGNQSDTGAGGEVSGNYCTLNPVHHMTNATLVNGNLQTTSSAVAISTFLLTSGKWYCEHTVTATGYNLCFTQPDHDPSTTPSGSGSKSIGYYTNGNLYWGPGSNQSSTGTSYAIGDTIAAAIDMDGSSIKLYKNGSLVTTIDFSSGTYHRFADGMFISQFNGHGHWNFGQKTWAYSAPTNFKAVCTTNLPTPTIPDGSAHFDTKLYTGNGSTQNITGYSFSPDLVWTKQRNSNGFHALFDPIRGVHNALRTHSTGGTYTDNGLLTAFNSDGFSVGSAGDINGNNNTYVAWAWDAGTSTVSNTDGSQTSQVRVNQTAGFSIVSVNTPNPSAQFSYAHGLNAAPEFVIHKFPYGSNWYVYHKSIGQKYINLNDRDAEATNEFTTTPTASVFTYPASLIVGPNLQLIAYCFTSVAGFSAFGEYTGNGSNDGPLIHTNFRPKFILSRRTDSTSDWSIVDSERNGYNFSNKNLYANDVYPESTGTVVDILSNGFKWRTTLADFNASGGSFIYVAFAENPFQANGGLAR